MTGPDGSAQLRQDLRDFVQVAGSRAPLYARLAMELSELDEAVTILAEAPPTNRIPVTLFAAIQYLLLADPDEPLAAWYPNLTVEPRLDHPTQALREFCVRRRAELVELVRSRTPQTNEIGRCAPLILGLAAVEQRFGGLAQLDVGASAGLNLLSDQYRYRYGDVVIGTGSVELDCQLRGAAITLPERPPLLVSRRGLDREPIDVEDPHQLRWLLACVWPDQADRRERLQAALGMARRLHPVVGDGDAVDDLPAALGELGDGHPVVTTSWVLNYLPPQRRSDFVRALAAWAGHRPLSWVSYESPAATPELDWPAAVAGSELTALRVVTWVEGVREDRVIGQGHPHGYWLNLS
ncbi:hypothetical protein ATK74_1097 [Propionicimonas paludicola]|uniref:DUF2332 domain-containing protein n=1 Tax=Propionicimonas paludicola TaxID=185243 RepID=A0A2A9CSE3_9ACTN|nr:DUF2332 domain-containing protein [Propionicimonas paludicola]PFG16550.1 hypothetical protein ATK74_1097 [Propionicimonas paludicola]